MSTKQLSIRTALVLAALAVFATGCNPEGNEAGECSDGVDNDQDGVADCDDPGCFVATVCLDVDGDGFEVDEDCDDNDPDNFPGNAEVCDGQDNDCDGLLDPTELDDDSDGLAACEGDCDDDDPDNFLGNTEVCDGNDNDCDELVDQDDVCERRAFLTSTTHDGNIGGLAGADAICGQLALDVDLGGSWVAWLSDDSTDAKDRLTQRAGPIVRLDGLTIADDIADLTDGSIQSPILVDETLSVQAAQRVWTGTSASGTGSGGPDWEDWATNVVVGGGDGQSDATGVGWTQLGVARCDYEQPMYCFEL
jgi:hypothetical protein